MDKSEVRVTQINLHHCKGASAVLARCQSVEHTAISLIQEPWVVHGCIRGLANCGRLFKPPQEPKPRACIIVKGLEARLLPELCSRDLVAVEVEMDGGAGRNGRMVICSAYFPHDDDGPPPCSVSKLVEYCEEKKLPLVLGCDANSHHQVWGSTDTNERGRKLLEFLAATNLEVRNRGSEPTFCTTVRREVIDLTLCSREIIGAVADWRVSEEPSLSDHRLITFRLTNLRPEVKMVRNPRKTDWKAFREDLAEYMKDFPKRYGTREELELCAEHLQGALVTSFEKNCPMRQSKNTRGSDWWSPRLQYLQREARRTWNRASNTNRPSDWALYKGAQKIYRDAVVIAKKRSWEKFCESIMELSEAARLCRILARDPDAKLETIRLPDGTLASGDKSLEHLLETNFPGFRRNVSRHEMAEEGPSRARQADWKLAADIVQPKLVEWAISGFKPFKSAGPDQIFPALLKEGLEQITGPLTKLLRACIALGYTPSAWKLARVVFIPKAGRVGYTNAKDFRPICLTSFLLKTLEKLVDHYIREVVLERHPLQPSQHAYRTGHSTETALHSAVTVIEEQLARGEFCVGIFLDIEGAFNNTPHPVICREAERHGVPGRLIEWVSRTLGREVYAVNGVAKVEGWVDRGCPQGGVLSPLLWCLVVDRLLGKLKEEGFFSVGFADDIAILVRGPYLQTLMELSQRALRVVEGWCRETGLTVNPSKAALVIFTRKYKIGPVTGPTLNGTRLVPTDAVKYLGVTLDKKLLWREHLEIQCRRTCMHFWACRRTFGVKWGLRPGMIYWLLSAVLLPRLLYAAVVWWPGVETETAKGRLERVRALILRGALGAMRTTPVAAMGVLLGVEPLHLSVIAAAAAAAHRLRCIGLWRPGSRHTRLPDGILSDPVFEMRQDRMPTKRKLGGRYKVAFPAREEWGKQELPLLRNGEIWYTDGSRMGGGAGAGLWCSRGGACESISLGEYATVFQAEVAAILTSAMTAIRTETQGRRIRICSDSQAAIAALAAPNFNSRLVWDCKCALDRLGEDNDVVLVWVPGHSGIKGNETADLLAKAGSTSCMIGPEPALGIPYCLGRERIRAWLRRKHQEFWEDSTRTKCRQARALMEGPSDKGLALSIRSLSRGDARLVVQMLTGHGTLNYHMHKLRLSDRPDCKKCMESEETSLHVLGQCPALARTRLTMLGSPFLEPEQIRLMPVGELLSFWKKVTAG